MNNHALVPSRRRRYLRVHAEIQLYAEEEKRISTARIHLRRLWRVRRRSVEILTSEEREERRKWARTRGPRNIKLDFLVVVGGVSATATYR